MGFGGDRDAEDRSTHLEVGALVGDVSGAGESRLLRCGFLVALRAAASRALKRRRTWSLSGTSGPYRLSRGRLSYRAADPGGKRLDVALPLQRAQVQVVPAALQVAGDLRGGRQPHHQTHHSPLRRDVPLQRLQQTSGG